jgi:hypothetical protein
LFASEFSKNRWAGGGARRGSGRGNDRRRPVAERSEALSSLVLSFVGVSEFAKLLELEERIAGVVRMLCISYDSCSCFRIPGGVGGDDDEPVN